MKGLVLAGGRGSRMGREKGGMRHPDGRTLVRRAVDLLREAGCDSVVVSLREGQDFSEEIGGVDMVRDAGDGPLGGMIAGMETDPEADWLLVACDLPRLEARVLRGLMGFPESFVVYGSAAGIGVEPLCGFYGRGAVGILSAARDTGRWGLQKILLENDARVLALDAGMERALENANNQEDWKGATTGEA